MSTYRSPLASKTPANIAAQMLGLRKNFGRVLDPASREGGFTVIIDGCFGLGLVDGPKPFTFEFEFLEKALCESFETIICETPFCAPGDYFSSETDSSLLGKRANSYMRFIERGIDLLPTGGELILLSPKAFLRSSATAQLNQRLFDAGTITHCFDLGDKDFYDGQNGNSMVWRYEKGDYTRKTVTLRGERQFVCSSGQLLFVEAGLQRLRLGDLFNVKVGAISGANSLFTNDVQGDVDFVVSSTAKDGQTRRMIWCPDAPPEHLQTFKAQLMGRRVARFTEKNWWHWGRSDFISDEPRIYVNERTRNTKPFFAHPCKRYDSSVLALFPKHDWIDVEASVSALNGVDWASLGFTNDGRFMFAQKTLEDAIVSCGKKDFQGKK